MWCTGTLDGEYPMDLTGALRVCGSTEAGRSSVSAGEYEVQHQKRAAPRRKRCPLCVGSYEWLKGHPLHFALLALSCLFYSGVGLYILASWEAFKPTCWPFTAVEGSMAIYGGSVVVQGLASFLGDIYSPYVLFSNDSFFNYFDIALALTNTGLGILALGSVDVDESKQATLTACAALFTTAACITFPNSMIQFRRRNWHVWVWSHIAWHLVPCSIAVYSISLITH